MTGEKQYIHGHYMLIFLKRWISMFDLLNDRELLEAHTLFLNVLTIGQIIILT